MTIRRRPFRGRVSSSYSSWAFRERRSSFSRGSGFWGGQYRTVRTAEVLLASLPSSTALTDAEKETARGIVNTIKALEGRLAAARDDKERETLQTQLDIQRNHLEGTNAVRPTPPNVTLTNTMTLFRGSREIRIMHLGRGHTAGDVVVYLPKERVVATGDLLVEGTSYMGDAFFTDWIDTIDTLKSLDFDTVLPGHGRAFHGKAKLDHWQAYLRDFWAQAQKFHKAGVPWEEAAKQVDLRGNAANYPSIRAPGITPNHGMRRAYEILDGKVR